MNIVPEQVVDYRALYHRLLKRSADLGRELEHERGRADRADSYARGIVEQHRLFLQDLRAAADLPDRHHGPGDLNDTTDEAEILAAVQALARAATQRPGLGDHSTADLEDELSVRARGDGPEAGDAGQLPVTRALTAFLNELDAFFTDLSRRG